MRRYSSASFILSLSHMHYTHNAKSNGAQQSFFFCETNRRTDFGEIGSSSNQNLLPAEIFYSLFLHRWLPTCASHPSFRLRISHLSGNKMCYCRKKHFDFCHRYTIFIQRWRINNIDLKNEFQHPFKLFLTQIIWIFSIKKKRSSSWHDSTINLKRKF